MTMKKKFLTLNALSETIVLLLFANLRRLCIVLNLTVIVLPLFTSCNGDEDPIENPVVPSEYIYVLNCGKDGSNNASLTLYDVEKGKATQRFFETQNGRRLGDVGQDLLVYGSKMYIAMFGESTIEATDLEAKSIKQITTEGQPRYLTAYGGKVYVTYFNGYVARIDTTTLIVEAKTPVGRNPEKLTVENGKLFITNSGGLDFATEIGYDKTVSIIDIATFTETQKIEVVVNPCDIVSDKNGFVYVVSIGNYMDIPNTLQKINASTGEISIITAINATYLATAGTKLYAIHAQYDDNWNQIIKYYAYDMGTNSVLSDNFIGSTTIDSPYLISSDEESGEVYITSSDYINNGDVYIFDKSNQLVAKFETGLNPMKAVKIVR